MTPRAPLTLAIETSNPPASGGGAVALIRDGDGPEAREVLGIESLGAPTRHEDALAATIARLCVGAGVTARDLGRVAVSIGPGGFTSIRIAVTTARVIAETTGAALFGVPTALGVQRHVARDVRAAQPVAVFLAWKRNDVWVQGFGRGADEPEGPGHIVALDGLGAFAGRHLVMEARLRDVLIERGRIDRAQSWSAPAFDPVAVHEASLATAPIDPAALVPLYPREPEAVRTWRERGSPGA